MSVASIVRLFRTPRQPGRPRRPDGARRPPARAPRPACCAPSWCSPSAFVVALFFYDQLLDLVLRPVQRRRRRMLGDSVDTKAYIKGAAGPLLLQLKLSGIAALVVDQPVLALPDLGVHRARPAPAGEALDAGVRRHRRPAVHRSASRVGYYVLPKGLEVLIGFTPAKLENLVEFGEYFSFFTRMLLVFGVSFEIPLFVVLLNLAGVVSGRALGEHRAWIIVGVFVFAAAATPSTDPFSMLMLAVPMTRAVPRLGGRRPARRPAPRPRVVRRARRRRGLGPRLRARGRRRPATSTTTRRGRPDRWPGTAVAARRRLRPPATGWGRARSRWVAESSLAGDHLVTGRVEPRG